MPSTPDSVAWQQVRSAVEDEADEPLGKSDLADPLGLDDYTWKKAIDALREDGSVEKLGRGRGTTYERL